MNCENIVLKGDTFSHISSIPDDKQYLFNKSGEYLVGK
jgi:hypothetical protein